MTGDEWMSKAACVGADPELFFREDLKTWADRRPPVDPHAEALTICSRCEPILECRKWAVANHVGGVAGGMTEAERARARRRTSRGIITPPVVISRDDEVTRERLYRQGLSDTDIGAAVGRAKHTILDWRKARGYPPNINGKGGVRIPAWRLALYEDLYHAGQHDLAIAELTKTTIGAVKGWRRRRGYKSNAAPKQSEYTKRPKVTA